MEEMEVDDSETWKCSELNFIVSLLSASTDRLMLDSLNMHAHYFALLGLIPPQGYLCTRMLNGVADMYPSM